MTQDELAELVKDCPVLYHMAESGSWPLIQRDGLLSTSSLLDLYEVESTARTAIESERRASSVAIEHPSFGRAVIRDQKPMDDVGLRRCLQDGLSPTDWYRLLNRRVFLWLTRDRLVRLLTAKPYREHEHDVLELDTSLLIQCYMDRITLSPINSGATKPFPRNRGLDTFLAIANYPYVEWRLRRKAGERVVELAVEGGIEQVDRFVLRVTTMCGGETRGTLFER